MSETREIRIKRLIYQSWYRGCKETDRIVGYFCKDHIHDMTDSELDELELAMSQEDADIYAWCNGSRKIPEELQGNGVLKRIVEYDVVDAIRRYA